MKYIIGLLIIATCIIYYQIGKQSVHIPKCEPMTNIQYIIVKELPKTGALSTNK